MMLRVQMADAVAAARALMALEPYQREMSLTRMLCEASVAEAHRQQTGLMHPIWGDGSLMAAALRRPVMPEPSLRDAEYRACLIAVLQRLGQPCMQDRHLGAAGSSDRRSGAISSPHSVQ